MPITIPPPPPGYVDAVAVQERDLNADDDFGDDDEVVYYHSNTLFSIYAVSDGDENVVERYRYNAYGAATVLDADWSADADGLSDVDNSFTFTGRRPDVETALMQYRYRDYSSTLGRFLSRDPVGASPETRETVNTYCSLLCSPSNRQDPLGLSAVVLPGPDVPSVSSLVSWLLNAAKGNPSIMEHVAKWASHDYYYIRLDARLTFQFTDYVPSVSACSKFMALIQDDLRRLQDALEGAYVFWHEWRPCPEDKPKKVNHGTGSAHTTAPLNIRIKYGSNCTVYSTWRGSISASAEFADCEECE